MSKLQEAMKRKLEGARFRMLNEDLYTKHSTLSFSQFSEEPDLFDIYHRGFREQVEKWPVHPLDVIIRWLKKYPKAVIADFGCGEARLAQTVPNRCHSFDLCAPNAHVTACDMAHVPLPDASVHIAVFCLSLMGTNLADFVREARRVLKPGGLVKVAEVRSRFEGAPGGLNAFLGVMRRLGFDQRQCDNTSTMFVMMEFKKASRAPEADVEFTAKACVYKRR
ncbi:methyltransferase-domain-containing protein [Tribonema minus]|uniref:Ribosomal RNA-processing protein 8 n=1 Tax=Tribonema minus TaxID=303371 RepID=A0A836C7W6_9STRA|nr:methyltransferase-domain-containing protein [Tribonema minus]